jgi:hypothetical protein
LGGGLGAGRGGACLGCVHVGQCTGLGAGVKRLFWSLIGFLLAGLGWARGLRPVPDAGRVGRRMDSWERTA